MMRSLYSGVSGLNIHQTRMDVIGNNISNVNTVGYRAQKVYFSDLFYQTTQIASGASADGTKGGSNAKQVGLGASVSQISINITDRGGSQSTGNALDMMINGDSFFVIQKDGANYYTKAGNFTTDGNGNLVTGSGNYVMGYTAARNEEGDYYLQQDELRPISIYGTYDTTDPAQTTEVNMTGNINPQDEDFAAGKAGYKSCNLFLFDSLGTKYGVQINATPVAGNPNQYTLTPAKVMIGTEPTEDVIAQFNGADSVTIEFDPTTGHIVSDPATFELTFTDAGGAALDSFQLPINVDFSTMTSFGSKTSMAANTGALGTHEGEGKAVGKMISLGVSDNGSIVASYSNGDTVVIGQIVTAKFSNAAGLEKLGDNLFGETLNSGDLTLQTIDAAGESISGGVVEMSNVDLAGEFVDMIVTQRGFQANSRVITVSDSMIEELLSLKR